MIQLKTFFPVQANEWLQVSCQFARSPKLREDLRYCSLRKENINFWEEDLTSENQECVTVTEDIFGTGTREIKESVLDENSAEVTTWYVAKKFINRSKCESCKILLKAGDNDIAHDA